MRGDLACWPLPGFRFAHPGHDVYNRFVASSGKPQIRLAIPAENRLTPPAHISVYVCMHFVLVYVTRFGYTFGTIRNYAWNAAAAAWSFPDRASAPRAFPRL